MDLPLIIMIASFLAALGGRAQQTVGQLAEKLSNPPMLASLVVLTGAMTAFMMAYLGSWLSSHLIGLPRALIVAIALVIMAFDLCRAKPIAPMREPTRSVGAIFLAMIGRQSLDAPRWLAFAGAAATNEPLGIALGATLGSTAPLLGLMASPELSQQAARLGNVRRALAAIALAMAVYIVWVGATAGG